jgi:hypothetical protein
MGRSKTDQSYDWFGLVAPWFKTRWLWNQLGFMEPKSQKTGVQKTEEACVLSTHRETRYYLQKETHVYLTIVLLIINYTHLEDSIAHI